MGWQETQASLAGAIPGQVTRAHELTPGTRVTVSLMGVVARGIVQDMAYHYHTIKGGQSFPVMLDGTGQVVDAHQDLLAVVA